MTNEKEYGAGNQKGDYGQERLAALRWSRGSAKGLVH